MENIWFLFAAYTLIWAIVFGYILFMRQKQKRLQGQIKLLKESRGKPAAITDDK